MVVPPITDAVMESFPLTAMYVAVERAAMAMAKAKTWPK